ncbi:DUF4178 domain-containing protein [Fibrella forsythiae]|uniref:DUF4178 domain-containing protein n=1 Tax=Fibrella forsythiae TaxID=2817061 RepID=A0ABS3JHK4_9BACT|nr:DUF4178 domain-containing protein [Fibrella forsythiae]MBO0949481.1 DUF4178 domain-containing protein [Fibrella forsythiae]
MTESLPTDATPWPAPDTVTCPNCQTDLTYYDPNSSFYACESCHAFFEAAYEQKPRIIQKASNPNPGGGLPTLAIGSEGYLLGEWVRVTGYMLKQEKGTSYRWREYMLLLKNGTTRQLAEYNGHWMWIEPASQKYIISGPTSKSYVINNAGDDYLIYARYQAELLNVVGEFDWNILDDERLTTEEYIAPPRMLVNEKGNSQNDWYEATYVSREDIAQAFGLGTNSLPDTYGVGSIQPNKYAATWTHVVLLTLLAAVTAIVIHLVNIVFRPSGTIFRETLTTVALVPQTNTVDAAQRAIDSASIAQSQPTPKMLRTRSFAIKGPTAVDIEFQSNVDNTWVEFATELVDEQTNQRYIFTEAVEYYHGYSDGENWTEGGTESSATLSKIPSGQYHLEITPYTQYGQQLSFAVNVGQNTSLISNVLLILGLLALYPIYLLFRRSGFENLRWSQSDFGPKTEEE